MYLRSIEVQSQNLYIGSAQKIIQKVCQVKVQLLISRGAIYDLQLQSGIENTALLEKGSQTMIVTIITKKVSKISKSKNVTLIQNMKKLEGSLTSEKFLKITQH